MSSKYKAKLTHDQRRNRRSAIAEFAKTHTKYETMNEFGVSKTCVRDAIKEHGVSFKKDISMLSSNSFDVIALLINTEKSLLEIASDLHMTHQRVSQIYISCKKAGIPVKIRKRGCKKEE